MSDGRLSTPVLVAPHVAAIILLRQVPVLEPWRVVACSQGPTSFCSQMPVIRAERVPLGDGCSQHVGALTTCCERWGLVETGSRQFCRHNARIGNARRQHPCTSGRLSRSIETRVGILNRASRAALRWAVT